MKIRQGFVSNSSSSLFVIVVPKNDFNEFFNELKDYEKELVNYRLKWKKFNQEDVAVLSGWQDNSGSNDLEYFEFSDNLSEDSEDYDKNIREIWEEIVNALPEHLYVDVEF